MQKEGVEPCWLGDGLGPGGWLNNEAVVKWPTYGCIKLQWALMVATSYGGGEA